MSETRPESPPCRRCGGPCVLQIDHWWYGPDGDVSLLACLACKHVFKGTPQECLDAENCEEATLQDWAKREVGKRWEAKVSSDRAKYQRALRGQW